MQLKKIKLLFTLKLIPLVQKYPIFTLIGSSESSCYTNVFKKGNDLHFPKFRNDIQRTGSSFLASVVGTVTAGIYPTDWVRESLRGFSTVSDYVHTYVCVEKDRKGAVTVIISKMFLFSEVPVIQIR